MKENNNKIMTIHIPRDSTDSMYDEITKNGSVPIDKNCFYSVINEILRVTTKDFKEIYLKKLITQN